jgi:uncharacterized membrane protein
VGEVLHIAGIVGAVIGVLIFLLKSGESFVHHRAGQGVLWLVSAPVIAIAAYFVTAFVVGFAIIALVAWILLYSSND